MFCGKDTNSDAPTVKLREKGSHSVNVASEERQDDIQTVPGQIVHQKCRREFCNPYNITKARPSGSQQLTAAPQLRSYNDIFDFKEDCLYCGRSTQSDRWGTDSDVFKCTLIETRKTLLDACDDRNDEWGESVRARILGVHDLPAADALYHQQCSVNFRTGKYVPEFQAKRSRLPGRPPKCAIGGRRSLDSRIDAFNKVVQYVEDNGEEPIPISELVDKMQEYQEGSTDEPYGAQYMRKRLQDHFGERAVITIKNQASIICLRQTADSILLEFHSKKPCSPEDEKARIIQAAAKFIHEDIKSAPPIVEEYPGSDEVNAVDKCMERLPNSLHLLLSGIVKRKCDLKVASIGQCLMQATRPRALVSPLHIALSIQLHHHFSSRFLIDQLHSLGFCSPYSEVKRFEISAATSQGNAIPNHDGQFVQYSADNVDHNISTLDGHNTFHGMGIIAIVTPGTNNDAKIPRNKNVTAKDLSADGAIEITYYREDNRALAEIRYVELPLIVAHDPTANLDILWQTSILFTPSRAAWSGLMQLVHHGDHPGKSSVTFLPMIDLSASDPSCIFSTLQYVTHHAKLHNATPIITFDQPLWWKALSIILAHPEGSEMRRVVLRLGTFHLEMSFLGSIGHIMASSGISELLELIYAPNAVVHIMSGKAVSRAVRAHLLLDGALNSVLLSQVMKRLPADITDDAPDQAQEHQNPESNTLVQQLSELYDQLTRGELTAMEANSSGILLTIKEHMTIVMDNLQDNRTAKLWMQYLDMVRILRKLLKAERLGNWLLHLQAVREALPYLAASGHNLYAKSARIYLQSMVELETTHPDVYKAFKDGYHVARRSDREWAGLSTDLMIEQVLMRSVKTSGGLTRGRGMTETQRLLWVMSMSACAEVNRALQELTGINYATGEQNKEMAEARKARDTKDTTMLVMALTDRNPFDECDALFNIMTGVHASSAVNVDTAKTIGENRMTFMNGQVVTGFVFRRSDQAITFATKTAVKIGSHQVVVDPQILFQRLIFASKQTNSTRDIFKYELCGRPAALFDENQLPRDPQKSVLAEAIWSRVNADMPEPPTVVQYVLDGGALLHRLPWPGGSPTYREICLAYCNYVTRHYGNAKVVFDGYDGASTKDAVHHRRSGGRVAKTVSFTDEMRATLNKDIFLTNKTNKQAFIKMLGDYLQLSGCDVLHATGDADLLIVQTAIISAESNDTILVGEDTDLIVLLCYYARDAIHDIFMLSQHKVATQKTRVWDMKHTIEKLGADICQDILFIHAICGCDTTSRLFGIGKGTSLKKYTSSANFRAQAVVFREDDASVEAIVDAGERAIVSLYSGKQSDTLDDLRYNKFCEKSASRSKHVQPQNLPPTSAAAKYHSMRVYLQVTKWKGLTLRPEEWGWQIRDGEFTAIMTDLSAAPENLLKVISCSCASDCSSFRCSCRKNNITCTSACVHCRGTACMNSSNLEAEAEASDNDGDLDE